MNNKNNLPKKKEKGIWNSIKIKINEILFFFKNKKNDAKYIESKENENQDSKISAQFNERVTDRAKRAYKNYILNFDPDIISDVYNLIKERLEYNKNNITSLLKIENNNITFEEIMEIFNNQRENIANFKKSICTKKLDDKFIYSEYQVPIRNNWNDIKR